FETRHNGSHGFGGTSISKIIVDPNNHDNLFIGNTVGYSGYSGGIYCCGTATPVSGPIGLYLCTNAQAATPKFAWLANLPGGGYGGVDSIAIEPTNANNLIVTVADFGSVGSVNSGIYRSINALSGTGATFTRTLNLSGGTWTAKLATAKVGSTLTVLAATS